MLGGRLPAAITVNPPASEKTRVALDGKGKVRVASLAPAGSEAGMLKTAVTVYRLACVTEAPVIVPRITLWGMTPTGGAGGVSVSRVKVTTKPVVPCGAEFGLTAVI
jgi:hypothetical protein